MAIQPGVTMAPRIGRPSPYPQLPVPAPFGMPPISVPGADSQYAAPLAPPMPQYAPMQAPAPIGANGGLDSIDQAIAALQAAAQAPPSGPPQTANIPFNQTAPDMPAPLPVPAYDIQGQQGADKKLLSLLPLLLLGGGRFAANALPGAIQGGLQGIGQNYGDDFSRNLQNYNLQNQAQTQGYTRQRQGYEDALRQNQIANTQIDKDNQAAITTQKNLQDSVDRRGTLQEKIIGLQSTREQKAADLARKAKADRIRNLVKAVQIADGRISDESAKTISEGLRREGVDVGDISTWADVDPDTKAKIDLADRQTQAKATLQESRLAFNKAAAAQKAKDAQELAKLNNTSRQSIASLSQAGANYRSLLTNQNRIDLLLQKQKADQDTILLKDSLSPNSQEYKTLSSLQVAAAKDETLLVQYERQKNAAQKYINDNSLTPGSDPNNPNAEWLRMKQQVDSADQEQEKIYERLHGSTGTYQQIDNLKKKVADSPATARSTTIRAGSSAPPVGSVPSMNGLPTTAPPFFKAPMSVRPAPGPAPKAGGKVDYSKMSTDQLFKMLAR